MKPVLLSLSLASASLVVAASPTRPPNIVLILADDLGYGDATCNRQGTGIHTPAIDRLATEGMRLTNGYAPASTCTPTRYAMMTGEYAWRKQGTGILPGDAKLIISPGRTTLASILKDADYTTALIGKWHLGLGDGKIDWNQTIAPGPNQVGFDYSYHMPATGDRVPCVYMENGRVMNLDPADPITVSYRKKIGDWPSGPRGTIINDIPRIGWMTGGKAALWDDTTKSDIFNAKALDFIRAHKSKPFFLFYAAHEPHHPQVPNPRFSGKANANGTRGDAIVQLDEQVAQIMKTLKEEGIDDETLVIFSSDNGCQVSHSDPVRLEPEVFRANGIYRGGKYGEFEGGQRMPFIVRWNGHIKPGTVSSEPVSLIDLPATVAALVGRQLAPSDAPDSLDILPVLTSGAKSPHSVLLYGNDQPGGIREGQWKLIVRPQPENASKRGSDMTGLPYLFDLESDPGEASNVANQHPDIVKRLASALNTAKQTGFTRPGAARFTGH